MHRSMPSIGWRAAATLLACAALTCGSAQAQWLRAEGAHVVVYGNTDEDRVRTFARKLERFHMLLELMIPGPDLGDRPKLPVYLVRNGSDLQDALPSSPDDLAGLYVASVDGIQAIAIARHANAAEGDDTLLHEYTHHFMYERARGSYPTWFVEGFAEYYSTAEVGDRITVGKPSRSQVDTLTYLPWIGFDEVLTGSPWGMSERNRSAFYAQSWLLTHYLLRDPARWTAAQGYFRALPERKPAVEAFQQSTGMDMDALKSALRRYGERGMQYSRLESAFPEPAITLTHMPASADQLMLPAIGILFGDHDDEALAALRAGPTRFPGDAFAIEFAARAELAAGNPQRAIELLTPLLGDAAAPELCFVAGMANMALAASKAEAPGAKDDAGELDYVQAANLFVRTVRGDPMHYRALYRYWQIRARTGEAPDTRLQDVLVQAYNLAPQAQEIAINAGFMLLGVARTKEARGVLAALAGDPHGDKSGDVARRLVALLDTLPEGRTPTPDEINAAISGAPATTPKDKGTRVTPQPNEA